MSRIWTSCTSTPKPWVDKAICAFSSLLMSSLWARRLSSSWRPMIERRLVMAMRWLASRKLSTPDDGPDGIGDTEIDDRVDLQGDVVGRDRRLGGMSTTSTRRFTLTTRSIPGMRKMRPGPLAWERIRPKRKNTARWYSVTTARSDRTTMSATNARTTRPPMMPPTTASEARMPATTPSVCHVPRRGEQAGRLARSDAGKGQRHQHRNRDPVGHVALDVVPALGRRSVHDQLVDDFVADRPQRRPCGRPLASSPTSPAASGHVRSTPGRRRTPGRSSRRR